MELFILSKQVLDLTTVCLAGNYAGKGFEFDSVKVGVWFKISVVMLVKCHTDTKGFLIPKGLVQPKIKILSSFTHPHIVSNI